MSAVLLVVATGAKGKFLKYSKMVLKNIKIHSIK